MRRFTSVAVVIGILVAGLFARAQVQPNTPRGVQPPPQIISGADFGFRVDAVAADGTPTGKIVVRQNGQWVEVGLAGGGGWPPGQYGPAGRRRRLARLFPPAPPARRLS